MSEPKVDTAIFVGCNDGCSFNRNETDDRQKFFVFKEYNWSVHPANAKSCQTWVVYQNGHVCSTAEYGNRGVTEVKHAKLKKWKVRKLYKFCTALIESKPESIRCFDGTGYEMFIYNHDGTEKYCFSGYIYGNKLLESIRDFIHGIRGLYFGYYDIQESE